MYMRLWLAAFLGGMALGLAGCGGGGGTPSVSRVNLTVNWAARARAAEAPPYAQSYVARLLSVPGGISGGQVTVNRRDDPAAYSDPASISTVPGTWDMVVEFHALKNGQGDVVARASAQLIVAVGDNDAGAVATDPTFAITSIALNPNQSVRVGEAKELMFTARRADNTLIALSPTAVTYEVATGGSFLEIATTAPNAGKVRGLAIGSGTVRVRLGSLVSVAVAVIVTMSYTVTDLGELPGAVEMNPLDINDSGKVVGYAVVGGGALKAFSWQNGTLTALPTLGGPSAQARGVNNAGVVVGQADTSLVDGGLPVSHAVRWSGAQTNDLGTLGGLLSVANALNDLGQVVGRSDQNNTDARAALWQSGQTVDLGVISGIFSEATDINTSGLIVGFSDIGGGLDHAFSRQSGALVDLGTLFGYAESVAEAVNDSGLIVGYAQNEADFRAVTWQGTSITQLPALPGMPASNSQATDVSNSGLVVGYAYDDLGSQLAVLWQGSQVVRLNDQTTNLGEWNLMNAIAINDAGQIVGLGSNDGRIRAFLLTPAPIAPSVRANQMRVERLPRHRETLDRLLKRR